uniref:sesquipedalian-1 n=1 Tax=Myxine glutinosa TaxID=7769 RepID=UPI00358F2F00
MKLNKRTVAHFAMCKSYIDKEGTLLKRGEVNAAFQRRWFVLKGNMLFYFDSRDDREPAGLVVLEGCTVELSDAAPIEHAFSLRFTCANARTYTLAAQSHGEMTTWMRAITSANFDYLHTLADELERQHCSLLATQKLISARPRPLMPSSKFNGQCPPQVVPHSSSDPRLRSNTASTGSTIPSPRRPPPPIPPRPGTRTRPVNPASSTTFYMECNDGPGLASGLALSTFQELHAEYGATVQELRRQWRQVNTTRTDWNCQEGDLLHF